MGDVREDVRGFRRDLRVLEREVARSLASETGCCGVTLAQCHLLLEAGERGRTGVTELAAVLELDKSTLSRTVDGMCRAGLLSRETDPGNRRHQVIRLTAEGQARAETINGLCDRLYVRLLECIPAEKRRTVIESVALLGRAMQQIRKVRNAPCCSGEKDG